MFKPLRKTARLAQYSEHPMHRLTEDERPHYDRWLDGLAEGDPRLRDLLAAAIGRIAAGNLRRILEERGPGSTMKMGDLPMSKPLPPDSMAIVLWLKDAIAHADDWLLDVDEFGIPKRLSACESEEDLLDTAAEDYRVRKWRLPGP
ncbi:hypothetical protein [Mesorhizobium sp. 2RAF21]|uniref:hypothetical protein n=1 Tax=Mesorhizobium sp. 2RAF21 TaxID=3232995 RepID=UPI003F9C5FF8